MKRLQFTLIIEPQNVLHTTITHHAYASLLF